jgi:hypothetical protein
MAETKGCAEVDPIVIVAESVQSATPQHGHQAGSKSDKGDRNRDRHPADL